MNTNTENLPPGITPEKLDQFILSNWKLNAGFAYQAYLSHGRGTVNWMWYPDSESIKLNGYIVLDAIAEFDPHYINMVRTYDPREFIVLSITWEISPDKYSTYFSKLKVINSGSPHSIYSQNRN